MTNNTTSEFLKSGQVPNSHRERSALLDDLRDQLLSQTNKTNTMSLIHLNNKAGKLKLSDAIEKTSVDTLLVELGRVFGAKAAAAGNTFGGLSNFAQNAADTLEIEIHSPGGSVLDGYRIYHAIIDLRKRGVYVTGTINTLAASMASVVAMACNKINMVQGGRMLVHDVSQNSGGNAADHAKAAKLCDDMSNEIAAIYAAKTRKPAKAMRDLMKAETWMGADEALKAGFIDAVVPINQAAVAVATLPAGVTAQALAAAIVDEQEARAKASKVKTRAEFNALLPRDRNAFFRNGGKLAD